MALPSPISQKGKLRPEKVNPHLGSSLVSDTPRLLLGGSAGAGVLRVGQSPVPSGAAAFAPRKSEAPGAFQARDEGRSQRPSQGQSQLHRRQSSPVPSRQVSTARRQFLDAVTASPTTQCQAGVLGRAVLWKGQVPVPGTQPSSLPKGQKFLAKCKGPKSVFADSPSVQSPFFIRNLLI